MKNTKSTFAKLYQASRVGLVLFVISLFTMTCTPANEEEKQSTLPAAAGVTVGGLFPLSGSAADMGPPTRDGFLLFWRHKSELLGTPVDVLVEDNKSTPREGLTAYRALSQQAGGKSLLVLMTQLSGIASALAPRAKADGHLQFGLAASPNLLDHPWNYRSYASAERIGALMADSKDLLEDYDTAFILAMADEYGRAVAEAFKNQAANAAIEVLGQELFPGDADDVTTTVQNAISQSPDAIIVTGFGRAPILSIRRLRELGYQGAIFADPATAYTPFTKMIGEAAEGMYAVDLAFGPTSTGTMAEKFRRDYRQAFGRDADIAGAMAYGGMQVFAEAVRRAASLEVDKIAAVLDEGFTVQTVFGPTRILDRDIEFPLTLKVVRDGEARVAKMPKGEDSGP